jgi:hypothetical protein
VYIFPRQVLHFATDHNTLSLVMKNGATLSLMFPETNALDNVVNCLSKPTAPVKESLEEIHEKYVSRTRKWTDPKVNTDEFLFNALHGVPTEGPDEIYGNLKTHGMLL